MKEMSSRLRQMASGPTRAKLSDLNARLAAKIAGAEDALRLSADGVSQAAHSMVELIDRILRTAFTEQAVLDWIAESDRCDDDLTYLAPSGKRSSTKRGQALCFIYAGRPVEESAVHEILAAGVVSARTQLQALKHAEKGDSADVEKVVGLIAAVEGCFALTLRVGWMSLDDNEVDGLRRRLAA